MVDYTFISADEISIYENDFFTPKVTTAIPINTEYLSSDTLHLFKRILENHCIPCDENGKSNDFQALNELTDYYTATDIDDLWLDRSGPYSSVAFIETLKANQLGEHPLVNILLELGNGGLLYSSNAEKLYHFNQGSLCTRTYYQHMDAEIPICDRLTITFSSPVIFEKLIQFALDAGIPKDKLLIPKNYVVGLFTQENGLGSLYSDKLLEQDFSLLNTYTTYLTNVPTLSDVPQEDIRMFKSFLECNGRYYRNEC